MKLEAEAREREALAMGRLRKTMEVCVCSKSFSHCFSQPPRRFYLLLGMSQVFFLNGELTLALAGMIDNTEYYS